MTRLVHAALLLFASVVVLAGQQTVFRGGGDTVRVFVTVSDGDRLVPGLTREQFEVRDDGKPQPITVFDNSPQPIQLIVMLDVSGSMSRNLPLLRASVRRAVRAAGRRRRGARRHVRRQDRHQPDLHARPRDIARRLADGDSRVRDDAAVAGAARPDRRVRRQHPAPCRAGAERWQRQRSGRLRQEVRQSARGDRSGARAGRDDLRGWHARPREPRSSRRSGRAWRDDHRSCPIPASARVAVESGGGYFEFALGDDLSAAFARALTSCTASICLASRRRNATARSTTSTCACRRAA